MSTADLLNAVEKLPDPAFAQFVDDVLQLRAQRIAPRLSRSEAELLEIIYQPVLSEAANRRFAELESKRRAETLTEEEQAELTRINATAEEGNVARVRALVELARLQKVTPEALLEQLGIQVPAYE